jgi:hypothetical protein
LIVCAHPGERTAACHQSLEVVDMRRLQIGTGGLIMAAVFVQPRDGVGDPWRRPQSLECRWNRKWATLLPLRWQYSASRNLDGPMLSATQAWNPPHFVNSRQQPNTLKAPEFARGTCVPRA